MKRFEDWTYQDGVAEIARRKKDRVGNDAYVANRAMIEEHNFWRNGDSWMGPRGTAEAWAGALKEATKKEHVPGAASIEALRNFVRGLFGKEANVQAAPRNPVEAGSEQEKQLKKEADELIEALSAWWDAVGLWRKLRHAGIRSRWAGWGPIRAMIPVGHLVEVERAGVKVRELPELDSLGEALAAIQLSTPEPDQCIAFEHDDTQQRAAVFHFVESGEGATDRNRIELWYEDGENTVLRILTENSTPEGPFTYEWGGSIPVAEMEGEVMLTEIVRRQEAALDFAETNVVKVGQTAGWRDRYVINAEPHGIWLPTKPVTDGIVRSTETRGTVMYFHPLPRTLGPAITNDLYGVKLKSDDGKEVRATPSVEFADPVDPDFAIKGAYYRRKRVLELCGQGHLAMIGTGESSGFAYEQARSTFRGDLEWHKSPAEMAIASLIEAVIRMAESMTKEPKNWLQRFRIVVTLTVDPGPVSPEMMDRIFAQVEKGLLARPSAMGKLGVEDVAAELALIGDEPESVIALRKKQIEAVTQLVAEGMPWERAAKVIGIDDEEQLKLFREQDKDAEAKRIQEEAEDDDIADALRTDPNAPPAPAAAAA